MKIKLLYFITGLGIGGAEMAMVRILNNLPESKYEINILSITSSNDIEDKINKNYISVIKLNIDSKKNIIRLVKDLVKIFRDFKPDVLVCSLYHATILGRIIGKLTKVPVIINWEHNENFGNVFRKMINYLTAGFSNHILADSYLVYNAAKKQFKKINKISVVQIGGLDLCLFSPVIHQKKKKIHIGSIGSLVKQKNYSFLIELTKDLPHFCVVQVAGDGPQYTKLNKMISENGLENRFLLKGKVTNIPSFLSELDIYIQPSLWEGLCISVIEAAAVGLPIAAFNVGGIHETVYEGRNGFLVKPRDYDAFKERLFQLISNPSLREKMGKESRKIAEEKYALNKMVNSFSSIIEKEFNAVCLKY